MNGSSISVRGAVHDRSASIFLFSLGVAKIFGLRRERGGGGESNGESIRFLIYKLW